MTDLPARQPQPDPPPRKPEAGEPKPRRIEQNPEARPPQPEPPPRDPARDRNPPTP